jgi:hypothetical protein
MRGPSPFRGNFFQICAKKLLTFSSKCAIRDVSKRWGFEGCAADLALERPMKVIIRETGAVETLSIIDPKTGSNYAVDFVGNEGAFFDGQFVWDEEREAFIADQSTFDWWQKTVNENQALDLRVAALIDEHGFDAVQEVLDTVGYPPLADWVPSVTRALDRAFGRVQ